MQRNYATIALCIVSCNALGSVWQRAELMFHRELLRKGGETVAIRPADLRENVIRPALKSSGIWSQDAEELLMLTAAKESQLGYYLHQLGNGPALSPWQIEPATFDWLREIKFPFANPLKYRNAEEMLYDLRLGALAARLRYLTDPEPLPSADDIEGMAKTWKRVFNTVAGKGRWEEARDAYVHYVIKELQ